MSHFRMLVVLLLPLVCGLAAAQGVIEGYADYETFAARLKELEQSELVSVSSLAKTLGGREILLLTLGTGAPESPKGEGSFTEWAYFHFGRWSFAARAWWLPRVAEEEGPGEEEKADDRGLEEVTALQWFEQEQLDGFVEWTEFDHPDFPNRKVEIGGFKPFVRLNPPAKELDSLAEKHADFVLLLAELMPRLVLSEIDVEDLGKGVWRVTATVVNSGYFPTASAMGETNGEPYPVQLRIELPENVSLVTGNGRERLPALAGNGGKAEQSWLVLSEGGGEPELTLTVYSPPVGSATRTVRLK